MKLAFKYKIEPVIGTKDRYKFTILEQDVKINHKVRFTAKTGMIVSVASSVEVSFSSNIIFLIGSSKSYISHQFVAGALNLQRVKDTLEEFRLKYCKQAEQHHRLTTIFR